MQSHIQEERVMTNLINWIGIDDSADKWVIAHYHGAAAVAAREFELVPG